MSEEREISPDFPFESKYLQVHGSYMHYIDEGSGAPVLFLHGNPTSSYLWRNVIPHLTPQARCIAPDLIGMGKSDKPGLEYRFFDHVHYLEGFIYKLGLKDLALVVHDWGSALGFHYARRHERNVRCIAFMEAILRPMTWQMWRPVSRRIFQAFRTPRVGWQMIVERNMFIEEILPGAVLRGLSRREMDHYREPFLCPPSRKPLWRWPNELPIEGKPSDVVEAVRRYNEWLRQSDIPKLLFYASPGVLIDEGMVKWCRENLTNLTAVDLGRGIHFLQEDNPHRIGAELARWLAALE